MKHVKHFLLLAVVLLSAMSAEAKVFSYGVTAGVNSNNFSIADMDDAIENNLGYQFGLAFGVNLPILSLVPEVIYTSTKFDMDSSVLGSAATVRSSAIDIPVLLSISVLGPLKIVAGPRFTLCDKSKATFAGSEDKVDLGALRSDFGYTVGLRLALFQKFSASLRFNGQFDNPEVNFNNTTATSYKLKYNSYSLSLGYSF